MNHPDTFQSNTYRSSLFSSRAAVLLGSFALTFVLMSGVLLGAGVAAAQQRTHEITWGHPNPGSVSRFVVLVSPVEGLVGATREINIGLPASQRIGGLNVFSAVVSFESDEYLDVTAVGHDGRRSSPSSWSGMPPSRPGRPVVVGN